ncbi:hypothetical protein [Alloalcanivorax mobilis]|uniref:hypothetical protein n=1 Tax=Alloalcanivorax mobilis TaxID=2019569 RepID=UPI000B5B227D|nr:hypothetical protein [Alloalcanivorax mobilis]ASK34682.1 hypothetical protein CEK62_09955 [Alcanivorax sp. N3-2A]|tara:strand:+ start:16794 stop:17027 length:234 start_codon:yes stop_codon:yes gene_type:complete
MSDHNDDFRDDYREEARELLSTIEQVEETLSVMTTVVSQLKEQVATHLDDEDDELRTVEMSAEEFLEQCENLEGTWH